MYIYRIETGLCDVSVVAVYCIWIVCVRVVNARVLVMFAIHLLFSPFGSAKINITNKTDHTEHNP